MAETKHKRNWFKLFWFIIIALTALDLGVHGVSNAYGANSWLMLVKGLLFGIIGWVSFWLVLDSLGKEWNK